MIVTDFFILALICGVSAAITISAIGCVVLWRRVTFLGDAISHSATLGVVLGVMLGIDTLVPVLITSILFVFLVVYLKKKHTSDTLVAVFANGFLALGLLVAAMMKDLRVDILSYLFGDLLIVNELDIIAILSLGILILLWLRYRWRKLISLSISEDLAVAEGINVKGLELEFMMVMALLISVSVKIVGILLLSSMLVVPAATARNISTTPSQMVLYSVIIGAIVTGGGIVISAMFDCPSGPAIIMVAIFCYLISLVIRK